MIWHLLRIRKSSLALFFLTCSSTTLRHVRHRVIPSANEVKKIGHKRIQNLDISPEEMFFLKEKIVNIFNIELVSTIHSSLFYHQIGELFLFVSH